MSDHTLVCPGGEVKALGDGKIAGYLVRYGGPESADVQGDFFTAGTDFGLESGDRVRIYYHHGLDREFGKRHYGVGEVKSLHDGLWIDGRIDVGTEKGRRIYADAEAGRLGWSSGSADRFVERAEVKGKREIVHWPLNDASLSRTPVDPSNRAFAIKALTESTTGNLAPGTLVESSERLASEAAELVPLWDAAVKSRLAEGRNLSEAKRAALADLHARLGELVAVTRPRAAESERLEARRRLVGSMMRHGRF